MSDARLPFSPDPLLLTRTERLEAWLWARRRLYALLGWALVLFADQEEPDDLGDALKVMAIISACAVALAAGVALGAIR